MKYLLTPALALLGACSVEQVQAAKPRNDDSSPTCAEIRSRYATLTVNHRTLAARGYIHSTRQTFVERAQLAVAHPECFIETDLGELK